MPYKDTEKQRKAVRDAVEKHRGITKGITEEGITGQGITVDAEKAAKLLMVANSLNRDYIALDGKKGKLSDLVRYGVNGPTMTQVKERLQ